MSTNRERLAEAVRKRRVALGLTQESIKAAGGPSSTTVSAFEDPSRPVPVKSIRKLEQALQWVEGSVAWIEQGDSPIPLRPAGDESPEKDPGELQREWELVRSELPVEDLSTEDLLMEVAHRYRVVTDRLHEAQQRIREMEGGNDAGQAEAQKNDTEVTGGPEGGGGTPKPSGPSGPKPVKPKTLADYKAERMIEQGMPVETAADRDRDEPKRRNNPVTKRPGINDTGSTE